MVLAMRPCSEAAAELSDLDMLDEVDKQLPMIEVRAQGRR